MIFPTVWLFHNNLTECFFRLFLMSLPSIYMTCMHGLYI
jgi:hypothetical protein